ncbi:unnamed protein product [Didymodactylos carnosus]|uniref:Arrestin C-terminal-like domain-containing protein n=1 Tax=Didymodactylos carnosus TaxID=1234261 RepID=A0A815VS61_9BILA|nr:unnamed protein product [Didymodactylos carnosus]CAF1535897.1 unnamed protein product [Didymodactylos carnosus]CAF3724320.1 unnamed protein product [Didymodactylos carnosus]CAF4395714.1 unnamed protein product [Didymodactylos carnosus]
MSVILTRSILSIMGNKTSQYATYKFDRDQLFYWCGEVVSGTAYVSSASVDEYKIKPEKMYVELIGEIGYTGTSTTTDSEGNTHHQTEYYSEPFYVQTITYTNGVKEDGDGQFIYPFQLPLAHHLPPSVGQPTLYPHVRYSVSVSLNSKKWFKADKKQPFYITVLPRVPVPSVFSLPTIYGNQNRKQVSLKGTMPKLNYILLETITSSFEIVNPNRVLIKQIAVSLIELDRISGENRTNCVVEIISSATMNKNNEKINDTFSIQIPASYEMVKHPHTGGKDQLYLAPSFQFNGGIRRPLDITVQYQLKIEVKCEGFRKDFDVQIPITIGTEIC